MKKRSFFTGLGIVVLVLIAAALAVLPWKPPDAPQDDEGEHSPSPELTTSQNPAPENRGSGSRPATPVDFVRETIDMVVRDGSFTVTGTYFLRWNDASLNVFPLMYPFPVDGGIHFPESVTVTGTDSRAPLPFRENRERGVISFAVQQGLSDTFTVTYTQKTETASARYILTTTKAWGKPLERAAFIVTVPAHFRGVELTYEPDTVTRDGDSVIYRFTRTDFMPDHDLVVTWDDDTRRVQ